MPQSYKKLKKLLTFDNLMRQLDQQFNNIVDHRRNNTTYCLPDVLKSAFAMFSLKSPSLLSFQEQTYIERENLKQIYRLKQIPADTQMRTVLDEVEPDSVRHIFPQLFALLKQSGVVKEYEYWNKHLLVSIDGVQHFNSRKIHCASCTTKKRQDGTIDYQHSALAAVVVHPEHKQVLPIDFEPIVYQDGAQKNDCERVAAKRLCQSLEEKYPDQLMIVVEDALYANAPHIRQIQAFGWKYIINVKEGSHKSLFEQFEKKKEKGEVKSIERVFEDGTKHRYSWANNLYLNQSAMDLKVNMLSYEEEDENGKVRCWTWITSILLTVRTVEKVMKAGRARWKIENETFNTLKNQGYNFEHNYGHGNKNLASVLAMLMMLAFLVDQIQEKYCEIFQELRKGIKTRVKLWETMRSLFKIVRLSSMKILFRTMAGLYEIQLK